MSDNTTTLTFGRVPHPPFIDRYIPDSQTSAWNDLGPRVPYGTCQHTMVGYLWSTDRWFRDDPVTGRKATGLTDYGVGGPWDGAENDGLILRWNDPRGRRSGWANGGSDGLEGDGIAFVRQLGVNAINRNLVSIERSDGGKPYTALMSEKQFESLCQLHAYWADQARIPYYDYPKNVHVGTSGLIMYLEHREFAIKGCPHAPIMNEVNRIQARVREILKQYQGAVAVEPPPSVPAEPEPDLWPNGWTTAALDEHFGELLYINIRDGLESMVVKKRGFNAKGTISNAWVQRCVEDGITEIRKMPKPSHQTVTEAKDGTVSETLVLPRSGSKDWVAFKGDGNASWIWLQ